MPRNASGTYSLPVAAFVAGTTILSASMNSNLSDIATALTQSLATTGVSSMTGALKLAAGSESAPSLTLASDTTTGWYNNATGEWSWSSAGTKVIELNALGMDITGYATVSIDLAVQGALTVNGAATFNGATGLNDTTTILDATTPVVIGNTTNNASEQRLATYRLGSGAGDTASLRAIGTGANDVAGLRWYIDTTLVWLITETGFNPWVNLAIGSSGLITLSVDGFADFTEVSLPSSPSADIARLYSRDLGGETIMGYLDSTGQEKPISPPGTVIGEATAVYQAATSLSGSIPADDSTPLIGEGDAITNVSYTTKYATSKVRVRVTGFAVRGSAALISVALFADNNCLTAGIARPTDAGDPGFFCLEHEYSPLAAAAITFSVRSGSSNGGTYSWNALSAGNRVFGGVAGVRLVVEEILQ